MIHLPGTSATQAPVVYTIPLQLLSYHVAILKGTDVDQPRNLAKASPSSDPGRRRRPAGGRRFAALPGLAPRSDTASRSRRRKVGHSM